MPKRLLLIPPLAALAFWLWPGSSIAPGMRHARGLIVQRRTRPKPEPQSAPPTPAAKTMAEALASDDLCAAARADWGNPKTAQELLRALGLDYEVKWRGLTTNASPLDGAAPDADYGSEAVSFFTALRWAGWLEGRPTPTPDLERAEALLSYLRGQDPRNAAYVAFQLAAQNALGRPPSELHRTLNDLWSTNHFTTFSMELLREVRGRMVETPSKFVAGVSYLSQMPVPQYTPVMEVLRALDGEAPGVRTHVAALMAVPGLQARESFKLGGYNFLEYNLGRAMMASSELPNGRDLEADKVQPASDGMELFEDFPDCGEQTRARIAAYLRSL